MPDPIPSVALQGNDARTGSLQTPRLSLHAIGNIRKLSLQVRPRAGANPAPIEDLPGITGIKLPDKSSRSGFGRSQDARRVCAREGAHQSPQEKVNNEPTAYWLGPNDWLLVDPTIDADSLKVALRDAAKGYLSVVTDVTDAWSIIEISGNDAPARLAEGCSVDFHDEVFPSGHCALTRLQHLPVIIHRLDDTSRFRILVDRSVARFLWDWLRM